MKRTLGVIAGAAAIISLSLAAPVPAQERGAHAGGGGGERHNSSGGGGGGQAVERGGGGGAVSSSGGVVSGGGAVGGSSGFSGGDPSLGTSVGGSAVGRATFHPGPSPLGHGARRMGEGMSDAGRGSVVFRGPLGAAPGDAGTSAIPPGSRPNRNNPPVGTAVERGSVPGGGTGGGTGYPSNWYDYYWYGAQYGRYGSPYAYLGYYSPYSYFYGGNWTHPFDPEYLYGYGAFGLGSFYYDPMWWGGGGYSGGGSSGSGESSGPKGGLKLKVSPDLAAVYVDGTYYGIVDQYNSAFQRLELPVGAHRVELRAKGYQSLAFDVTIDRNDTVSYRGTMTPAEQK